MRWYHTSFHYYYEGCTFLLELKPSRALEIHLIHSADSGDGACYEISGKHHKNDDMGAKIGKEGQNNSAL